MTSFCQLRFQDGLVRFLTLIVFGGLLLIGALLVAAQSEVSDAACGPALELTWTQASDSCIGGPVGYVCNGGAAPQAEPAGPVSNSLAAIGAKVEIGVVEAITTPPLGPDSGGIAWLRVANPAFTGLAVGNVTLRNVTPPDFPAWQSMLVQTGPEILVCGVAPRNAFVVQTPLDPNTSLPVTSNIVVNGASLVFNGTVVVQTRESITEFINLGGQARVFARGQDQTLRTGQQISVPYNAGDFSTPAGAPSFPQPLDRTLTVNLPMGLLGRPLYLPQPGYVETAGAVNMRAEPSTEGALILQVPAGQVMSVLGQDPSGAWFHVRLDSGLTGWMFADLLLQNIGPIETAYSATPLPPQRYGTAATAARVVAASGANLRDAPDIQFGLIGTLPAGTVLKLLARSPYSPWVKVEGGGVIGWAALATLETVAVIESLPIDFDVPPPPEPTRVPGSFGNAFPDPNRGG
jgi:uncharacterized protein YraI